MRIVIAPDSFKGSASARVVAAAVGHGWREVRPGDEVVHLPLADGGEGSLDTIASNDRGARRRSRTVTGPDGRPVDAGWLELGDDTAVVELATACGLPLMGRLDPLGAATTGLGQLLDAATDAGAPRLIVTLGGSASTDGGAGALTALGARFLDAHGDPLPPGGGALAVLADVDLSGLRPAPAGGVLCLVDVTAPLLGPFGAAAVFGPQKGATAQDVTTLERGLGRLADVLGGAPAAPGSGAAGGTAYGLASAWDARLSGGATTIAELAGLRRAMEGADLVLTGEGRLDAQSLMGKVVGHVLDTATGLGVDTALVVGQVAVPPPPGVRGCVELARLAGTAAAAQDEPVRWLMAAGRQLAASVPTGRG
ncbi:glycerate kinase [Pseudonocardia sp.]|uniref:glycerate kinase n=1 Tax=Pseudonocardia sp. TaxID=60912 RepID=UPI002639C53B|nr:glycerate kinase [Pseudonocardia sp.]